MVYANNYQIGHRQITFIDSSRANRQIQCEIYYPSMNAGDNVPIAGGKFPVLVFGHGFVMPVSAYDVYWNALVPKGYIMVLPTTESSFSPSHTNFGKDIAHAVKSMRLQGILASSPFYNSVDSTSAVMGHSMGGGCAFLAMQYDQQITAIVSFAGAVTNPSSVTAASSITKPSLVIAGANDCVAPPKNHQIPMYDSLASQCKSYVSIIGGDHCQFASYNFNCSFGQSTCTPKATINANTQQSILFQHMIPWLNYYLKRDCIAGDQFQGMLSSPNGIMSNTNCTLESPRPNILGQEVCANSKGQLYSVAQSPNIVQLWRKPLNGLTDSDLTKSTISIEWTKNGVDTIFVRQTNTITNCIKDTFMIVTINELPEGTIIGEQIVCESNKNVNYLIQSSPGTTIEWHVPNNGLIIGSKTSNTVAIRWNMRGIDTVKATITDPSTGCMRDTFMIVTIQEKPNADIYGKKNICEDTPMSTYKVEAIPGLSYFWTVSTTSTIIGPRNLDSVLVRWTKVGKDIISLRATNPLTGCTNDTSLTITVNPKPRPYITGKSLVKEGDTNIVYAVPFNQGSMYSWNILSGDARIRNQDQYQVNIDIGKPGIIMIEVTESNKYDCASSDTFNISVQSASGIDDEHFMLIYPNPIEHSSILTIKGNELLSAELWTIMGENIGKYLPQNDHSISISTESCTSGMYMIRIRTNKGCINSS